MSETTLRSRRTYAFAPMGRGAGRHAGGAAAQRFVEVPQNHRWLTWKVPGFGRFGTSLLLLALWEAASRSGVVGARTLPAPDTILRTAWRLTQNGTLPHNLFISLERAVAGLALAIVAGVALALIAGLSRRGENIVDAPLQMIRTLPHLALVPLFILWFGIGETPKVLLVALGALIPIYLNLQAGIRNVDPKLVEMARVLRLGRWQTIRHVILPGALGQGLVGLRFAVGISWLSLVVAEQINASSGIGFMMMDAQDFLRTDIIMVGLLVYALLGLGTDQLVRAIERRALVWQPALAR